MSSITNKIFISNSRYTDDPVLMIQYSDTRTLHELFFHFTKKKNISFHTEDVTANIFSLRLTEQNIVDLTEFVFSVKTKFNVDSQIISYYEIIRSWEKSNILKQFELNTSASYYKSLIEDIGIENINNNIILKDRSNRYQYKIDDNRSPTNLIEYIAFRNQNSIWIDSNQYMLNQVIDSLIELKRTPILFVFDAHSTNNFLDLLTIISNSLINHNINDIGVYFRISNNESDRLFNDYVVKNKHNSMLTSNTSVAVIRNGKIPKFFLKNFWTPKSIVFLEHTPNKNKTSTYARDVSDLIITYSKDKPLALDIS